MPRNTRFEDEQLGLINVLKRGSIFVREIVAAKDVGIQTKKQKT